MMDVFTKEEIISICKKRIKGFEFLGNSEREIKFYKSIIALIGGDNQ